MIIGSQSSQKTRSQTCRDLLDQLNHISGSLQEVRTQRRRLFAQRQALVQQLHALTEQRQALYEEESSMLQEESVILAQLVRLRERE